METWHRALIGAVGGPLVGLPVILVADPALNGPLAYPVVQAVAFLGQQVFPNDHGRWSVFVLPVGILYFAVVGIVVALVLGCLRKRHST